MTTKKRPPKRISIEQLLAKRNATRSDRPHRATLVAETLDWLHIAERCEEEGDCWIWQGAYGTNGYPIMKWPGCRCATVRRIVLALDGRPANRNQPITSTCGERGCVNPDHLVASLVLLFNRSDQPYGFGVGERIAQARIVESPRVEFRVVEQLALTERGAQGFGHTGK